MAKVKKRARTRVLPAGHYEVKIVETRQRAWNDRKYRMHTMLVVNGPKRSQGTRLVMTEWPRSYFEWKITPAPGFKDGDADGTPTPSDSPTSR